MFVSLLVIAAALVNLGVGLDSVGGLVCTAPENLPCRPLTLECLFAGAGGLAAGLPAIPPGWGGFPAPEPPTGPEAPRQYAPDPPQGYQPPPPPSPQDALNDPDFNRLQEEWARENAGRVPVPRNDDHTAYDVFVESIRNSGSRR